MPVGDSGGQRLLVSLVLVVALLGTCVWYGAVAAEPDPTRNDFPENDDVAPAPGAYVGDRVTLSGAVAATDPVVMTITSDGVTWRVTLENASAAHLRGADIQPGTGISVHGTLTDRHTLATDRAVTRAPWGRSYMYGVSVIGAVWVLARAYTGWRIDRDRVAVVPREQGSITGTRAGQSDDPAETAPADRGERDG